MPLPAVQLNDVSVAFRLPRASAGTVKQFVGQLARGQGGGDRIWALRDVSIQIVRGEVLGVVGANGAGKSTLLRVLSAVVPPSAGRVIVRGRVCPLVDLGAGFDLEATARDNVVLYGALLGGEPRRLREVADELIEWAELEAYADVPLVAFSTGMLARLAFAVTLATEPDVLLLDEVVAVGDGAFQRRSGERIDALLERGCTVVFVSHALAEVERRATRGLWLHRGRVEAVGPAAEVVSAYAAADLGHGVGGPLEHRRRVPG